jgi:hypothetical protein
MRFGTWNVRSLYRAGSLIAADRELTKYKLYYWVCRCLVGTKWVTLIARGYNFLWERK